MNTSTRNDEAEPKKGLNFSWLMLMAWRDSRRNKSRLFLFISSIILGIAVLVAIYSLGDNLKENIDKQAAEILGADLQLSTSRPLSTSMEGMIDSLGDRRSEERSFASMVYFIKNGGSRLVQIRALQGEFPYYGKLETTPSEAGKIFRSQQQALVDQSIMMQFGAQVGDSIKVGEVVFAIAGSLLKAPGQTGLTASVSPAVFIPFQYLEKTGLSQKGSRINFRYYFKYDKPADIKEVVKLIGPRLDAEDVNYESVETQKEDTGRSFSDMTQFLSLVGFIALLLGCIGVASAIHIYVKEKINAIAILRCLGLQASQAFIIFLIQITSIGVIGSLIGVVLGVIIQQFFPLIIKDFLPIEITTTLSWSAILQGLALGIIISILFALLPLISVRKISPLNALRISFEPTKLVRDPLKWMVYLLIVLFIFCFTFLQMKDLKEATIFTASILVAFLVLIGIASLMMWLVRRFFPSSLSYVWRQGLANLFRPNNQTVILVVSIGLGTAFICTLLFIQAILLNRVTLSTSANQPNIVLFDIQTSQKEEIKNISKQHGLTKTEMVPIVNMRLEKWNDRRADETFEQSARRYFKDSSKPVNRTIFSREYRVTFRDTLTPSEKITKGLWRGVPDANGNVYISLEQEFARRNKIKLGDTMVFNIQGFMAQTLVGSFREVNWSGIQTNFLVVFPKGVLEEAPQFHVLLTHVPTQKAAANFQRVIVQRFPNVSIIDLGLVLSVLDDIFNKIGFVIKFMAGFSIITGLVVLIASVLISKYQRLQESVLLRTLGASRKQIFAISALEYFFLGAIAAATGILLALGGSWALAKYSFKTEFSPQWIYVIVIFFSVPLITMIIGLVNSRGLLTKPPLEILRQEV
ncbi:MAG TPA: FtsX-like permease family protein [Segetibacter sp.]|jgi:putative ABC transport system permease protein